MDRLPTGSDLLTDKSYYTSINKPTEIASVGLFYIIDYMERWYSL